MNKKKIFAVSDVHGHATALKAALLEAGFDANDPDHLLVGCGDYFDRGHENLAVLEYLSGINNKVLIRGNHEDLLKDLLDDGYVRFHDRLNGTDITVSEFFGAENIDRSGRIGIVSSVKRRIDDFLCSTVDYFETKNYVFVHGWVPCDDTGIWKKVWRTAPNSFWEEARFSDWRKMLGADRLLPDKTIVCGHRAAVLGCEIDRTRAANDYSPFYREGMIAIDTLTVQSGKVNVLVIEDEMLEVKTHTMKLKGGHFERMAAGVKTVEMRVFDEKRSSVKVGDRIVFTCGAEKLCTEVTGTYLYEDFSYLCEEHSAKELGFPGMKSKAISDYMTKIYGEDDIARFGAFAMRIKRI